MTHTDDSLDGLVGTIIETLEPFTGEPLKPTDLCYRVEYTRTDDGEKDDAPFRGNEVMMIRDQPATNHGAF